MWTNCDCPDQWRGDVEHSHEDGDVACLELQLVQHPVCVRW